MQQKSPQAKEKRKLEPCSNRCCTVVSVDAGDSGLDSAITKVVARMTEGEEQSSETLDSVTRRRRGKTLVWTLPLEGKEDGANFALEGEDETCDDRARSKR
ncbi:hypothetical protein CRG98_025810 [Punica granatum]|uniref:Uncharacterized protein n=1 Tax=Punica granatum TaxID=22663 RepID=A0A2I0JC50_PUNGR|nr:hypothetical protein CRG98_025810 [Punica granatum]